MNLPPLFQKLLIIIMIIPIPGMVIAQNEISIPQQPGAVNNSQLPETLHISPHPKTIVPGNGAFTTGKSVSVYVSKDAGVETVFSLQELSAELMEKGIVVKRTGRRGGADVIMGIAGRDKVIDRELLSRKLTIPDEAREEGYIVDISEDNILVAAATEAGLFYGIQTVKQLVRGSNNHRLPVVLITDWPSMRYRGWMDDISRGPIPTVAFLKECIRKMAEFKQNYFTLYTEHVFRLNSFPDIAPPDGLTAEEVKELIDFAARYHIDMVGNYQSFGHMAKMLAIPFYASLGENAEILNPADEATYSFLDKAYSEIVPSYKSPFFNINCDETFGLGEGKSKALAAEIGIDGIYASHINRIDKLIKPYGKRIMMWGDIAVNNPGIIAKLPKDLVILSWGYHAAPSFEADILPFRNSGFDFMVAPGVSCWNEVWPGMQNAVVNIANYTRDGHKLGALGMMNTAWDDNGHNLFNSNWHGLAWGAECSWSPLIDAQVDEADSPLQTAGVDSQPELKTDWVDNQVELKTARFNQSFNTLFFEAEGIVETLMAIDSLRNYPVPGILNEWAFWNDINAFTSVNTTPAFMESNKAIITAAGKLSERLSHHLLQEPSNTEMLDNAALALQRISFTAWKNIARILLYNARQSGDPELVKSSKDAIHSLKEQLYDIKKQYITLWQRENRNWWLDKNLGDYNNLWKNLDEAGNRVFIEPDTEPSESGLVVRMGTAYREGTIVYTTDGTEPNRNSAVYTAGAEPNRNSTVHTDGTEPTKYSAVSTDRAEPNRNSDGLILKTSALIKARAIINGTPGPVSEKYIIFHKGIGSLKKLHSTYSTYNPAYAAGGINGLLDGMKGSNSFADGRWQGYQGRDLDIELDLKAKTEISSISVDFLQQSYSWILLPRDVEILTSEDGITYTTVQLITHDLPQISNEAFIHTFTATFQTLQTRYLRIIAHNPGPLPPAHHAAGNSSFIFADEVIVR